MEELLAWGGLGKGGDAVDNFKIIYKILKYLEASLDSNVIDVEPVSAEQLRISYERWTALLMLLQEEGYISGLRFTQTMSDSRAELLQPVCPMITLKGLEYIAENGMMQKAGKLLKGIKEIVPGDG